MIRGAALAGVVGLSLLAATSCQVNQTLFATCSAAPDGDPFGTDGRYVLVCEDGAWNPIMTVEEFVDLAQHKDITIKQPVVCWPGDQYHVVQVGIINSRLNAELRGFGVCLEGTKLLGTMTVVESPTLGAATATCTTIDAGYDRAFNLRSQGYAAPSDYYRCSTNL